MTDNTKPGLSIESAASVILRDVIQQHFRGFSHVIQHDRVAGQSVIAAYTEGLTGAMALVVAGGHVSKDDVFNAMVDKLRSDFDRDLSHLRRG